ncbi:ATP-binding cassette domain-containing protein [Pseudomonas sp. FP2196]|uniref:ATP-binding cassette domain-containing protein n=1 Tax=Pseudomonas sp. FP2196 TaxID=2954086 RepID=UPI0027326381|nr:ATP-binding cassette domain-containing protein [Pseudomonas sp. FP2196]WLH33249.1 ATP-binding cassette domain-containing protein [Pseudomonas sp. FP2196]
MTHVSRTPALVSLHQLSFQFANGETIFNDLNLKFDHLPTAIVGRNGVGKSVLARLIARQFQPTAGTVVSSVSVHYVPQTFLATPGQTVADACLPWLPIEAPSTRLSLAIHGPMRIAVSGPNGCGKSTLLKLLAGDLTPVHGECHTPVPFTFLDQQLTLLDDRASIVDQLKAQQTPLDEGTLRSYLAHLQLNAQRVTQPCASLSGGERLKAALALAMWRQTPAQLLLLDEPTNHLDLACVEAFERALQTYPGAIVAVSHDQSFLRALNPTHDLTWHAEGWHLQPTS